MKVIFFKEPMVVRQLVGNMKIADSPAKDEIVVDIRKRFSFRKFSGLRG